MKRQQGKYIPDFWRRRHYLLSMVTRENASNLRRFSDALSLISKVFDVAYSRPNGWTDWAEKNCCGHSWVIG